MSSTKYDKPVLKDSGYYLTDGGLETTLIYHEDIDLPHFAAFELLNSPEGIEILRKYFKPYLDLAERYKLNFILETPTWRANTDWGFKLGYGQRELNNINRDAVRFVRSLKEEQNGLAHVLISGNIGPRGDGYAPGNEMSANDAKAYHMPQIMAFSAENADLVTALTLNYQEEAVGIVEAAREAGMPVVISFTVETDGHLPTGQSLRNAIEGTDALTGGYTSHFMLNCAHPDHFKHILRDSGDWKERIKGIRANASTKSHAELDESESLDMGDKALLANGYKQIKDLIPNLRIIGGCCGTDHSHLEHVCTLVCSSNNH